MHVTSRNAALLPVQQVLIALRYYESVTFHQLTGDLINVRISTTNLAIWHAYDSKINQFLKFSDNNYLEAEFFKISRFPCVIGCIDFSTSKSLGLPYG